MVAKNIIFLLHTLNRNRKSLTRNWLKLVHSSIKKNVRPTDIFIAQLKRHAVPLGISKEQITTNKTVIKRVNRARAKGIL